MAIP
jgi:hypothetical protein